MNFRSLRTWTCVSLLATTLVGGAVSTSITAGASAPKVTRLVILRPHTSLADRHALIVDAQRVGVTVVPSATANSIIVMRGTEVAISALTRHAVVKAAGPDQRIVLGKAPTQISHVSARATTRPHSAPSICGTQSHPELDPEAVTAINAPAAWASGATGAGVKVAYIAEGIDPNVPDFHRNPAYASSSSPAGGPVFSDVQDFSGEGTTAPTGGMEAFMDASSIAAQGNTAFDLSTVSSFVPSGCYIKIVGAAPGATLVGLKAMGQNYWTTMGFVQSIQYAVTHGVKVINESFGTTLLPYLAQDAIAAANDAAIAAGVTIVTASGDMGPNGQLDSTASNPNVISVGATTTYRGYLQTGFGGITYPGGNGSYVNNNVSPFSSAGTSQNGSTLSLVAPGDSNWVLCSSDPNFSNCGGQPLAFNCGTSESSPLVAAAAADVIQAYAASHHGVNPTPAIVKSILMSSATNLDLPVTLQGAGLVNVAKAVAVARSFHPSVKSKVAGGLLAQTNSLFLSGSPRATMNARIPLTNTGSTTATVSVRGVTEVASGVQSGDVNLDPSVGTSQPTFSSAQYGVSTTATWSGADVVYQTATLQVAAGLARLHFQADYQKTGQNQPLNVSLFDPAGNLAIFSWPGGISGYTMMDVAAPAAGTWTVVFFTPANASGDGVIGTSGPVQWEATSDVDTRVSVGVTRSISIAAGATTSIPVSFTLPATAGDSSVNLEFDSGANTVVVPVTERSAVVPVNGVGNFSGILTGGYQGHRWAQSNFYAVSVPKGVANVDMDLELANVKAIGSHPGTQVVAALLSPTGQMVAYDSNYTFDRAAQSYSVQPYVSLYAAAPAAGNYTLVLDFCNPVIASEINTPFRGQILINAVSITSNLPASSHRTVSQATGGSYQVTITNHGLTPMMVTADPRSTTMTTLEFGPPPSIGFTDGLTYYVPPGTTSLTVAQTSDIPATFDMSSYLGDPDVSPHVSIPGVVRSTDPLGASLTYAPAGGIMTGLWWLQPSPLGPFTATGIDPSAMVTEAVSALTPGFDTDVTTSLGDMVSGLCDYVNTGTSSDVPSGVSIPAGGTVVVNVTISPTQAVGSVERGILNIDTVNIGNNWYARQYFTYEPPFVAPLAYLPYSYTVGR
jgi:hypothetical protein